MSMDKQKQSPSKDDVKDHGPFDDNEEAFPHFSTNPKSVYYSHCIGRAVLLLVSLITVALIAASFGVKLAKVTLRTSKYDGVHFDVKLWSLGTNGEAGAYDDLYFDVHRHAWVNGGGRVCAILTLIFAVGTAALAVTSLLLLCTQEAAREADDVERERAMSEDKRERVYRDARAELQSPNNSMTAISDDVPKKAHDHSGHLLASMDSHLKPAWLYVHRENARRQTDFGVGVALVVCTVLSLVACLIAVIYSGAYLKGNGFAKDLADIFGKLYVQVSADDVKHSSDRAFQAGFWLQLVAIITSLATLLLTVVPCVSGIDLSSPRPLPLPLAQYNPAATSTGQAGSSDSVLDTRAPFGDDDMLEEKSVSAVPPPCEKDHAASAPTEISGHDEVPVDSTAFDRASEL